MWPFKEKEETTTKKVSIFKYTITFADGTILEVEGTSQYLSESFFKVYDQRLPGNKEDWTEQISFAMATNLISHIKIQLKETVDLA